MEPALSTRNLNKSFGSLVVAQDIALELPQGVRYALIGPNGAGKTTLMNLLTGMLRPDSGHVFLGPEEITSLRPDARVKKGLARTFQINTLFPQLSAIEAVTLAVPEREGSAHNWWRGLPRFGAAIDEAQSILQSLGMGGASFRATKELAYGQQRLLEIALALATRPRVLLLDEPAAGVNPALLEVLSAFILRMYEERPSVFLVIEHNMEFIMGLAGEIIVMHQGAVLERGDPQAIQANPRVIEAYLG